MNPTGSERGSWKEMSNPRIFFLFFSGAAASTGSARTTTIGVAPGLVPLRPEAAPLKNKKNSQTADISINMPPLTGF